MRRRRMLDALFLVVVLRPVVVIVIGLEIVELRVLVIVSGGVVIIDIPGLPVAHGPLPQESQFKMPKP